jgi:hypothetical protein
MPRPHELAAKRNGHKFILQFDSDPLSLSVAERQLGVWASDRNLPFDRVDASNLSRVIQAIRTTHGGAA